MSEILKISQCTTCGGRELVKDGDKYTCSYCGNVIHFNNENVEFHTLLELAFSQRQTAKFDAAFETYNLMVNKFGGYDLSDVYFGMFLSEFSVIFENNMKGEPFPSFYSMRNTPCQNNYYYKKAIAQAQQHNPEKLESFKEMGDKVEYVRKTYSAIEKSNRPYDIFICYKKTDNEGNLTNEFEKAKNIYKILKEMGFKVFFADESINKQAVREWEPNIYYALYTAKAMLVLCSKNEYIDSQWVKNEWKRFISIKTNDANRAPIIPIVCDDFKASELPNALAKYQALEYDADISKNIKEALLALTTKVNDKKEFLFKYKKPISKKLIASIVAASTALLVGIGAILAYYNIPRLKYEKDGENYNVAGCFGKCVEVKIPAVYKGKNVVMVKDVAFENNKTITSVNIGGNVEAIGRRSFAGMPNLKEVSMTNSVKQIGQYAFYNCDSLITITLSDGLNTISSGMLGACENLLSVTIPKTIRSIEVAAFLNCDNLSVINYTGTPEEWEQVYKGVNNGNLLDAHVAYYYEISDPTTGETQLIFISPTINYTIGKNYSATELQYNDTLKQWEIHKAVDFLTVNNEPVYAVQDGIVNSVYNNYLEGYVVSITHSQGFVSYYKSLVDPCVSQGQSVSRGQQIGKTGNTMAQELNNGNMLHFELMKDGIKVDPAEYINY